MSNESDDLYMTSEENENGMVQGIADGLDLYLSETVRSEAKLESAEKGLDFYLSGTGGEPALARRANGGRRALGGGSYGSQQRFHDGASGGGFHAVGQRD